jgi:hypothetical protein
LLLLLQSYFSRIPTLFQPLRRAKMKKTLVFAWTAIVVLWTMSLGTGFYYSNTTVAYSLLGAMLIAAMTYGVLKVTKSLDLDLNPDDEFENFRKPAMLLPAALPLVLVIVANCYFSNPVLTDLNAYDLSKHGVWMVDSSRTSLQGPVWAVPYYNDIRYVQTWRNVNTEVIAESRDGQKVKAIISATLPAQPTETQITSGEIDRLTEQFRLALAHQMENKITRHQWSWIRTEEVRNFYFLFSNGYNALDDYNDPAEVKAVLAKANANWHGGVAVQTLEVVPE